MVELEKSSPMTASTASEKASISSSGHQTMPLAAPLLKKKQNLPRMSMRVQNPKSFKIVPLLYQFLQMLR